MSVLFLVGVFWLDSRACCSWKWRMAVSATAERECGDSLPESNQQSTDVKMYNMSINTRTLCCIHQHLTLFKTTSWQLGKSYGASLNHPRSTIIFIVDFEALWHLHKLLLGRSINFRLWINILPLRFQSYSKSIRQCNQSNVSNNQLFMTEEDALRDNSRGWGRGVGWGHKTLLLRRHTHYRHHNIQNNTSTTLLNKKSRDNMVFFGISHGANVS